MADYNNILDHGDYGSGVVNTVSEIPERSILKIEWSPETKLFSLDRVEPQIFAKPCGYGFIPRTLDEDGDPLDTLIVCSEPIPTGVWFEATIIGIYRAPQKITTVLH
jgi:inorganic pyrophosphatase